FQDRRDSAHPVGRRAGAVMNARPRLLYILHQFDNFAGVELLTQILRDGLRDRYEISLAYPTANSMRLRDENDSITEFIAEKILWPGTPLHSKVNEDSLAKLLAAARPDVIHIQHFLNWPLSVIDQATALGVPVVVSFHDAYAFTPKFTMQGATTSEETFTA